MHQPDVDLSSSCARVVGPPRRESGNVKNRIVCSSHYEKLVANERVLMVLQDTIYNLTSALKGAVNTEEFMKSFITKAVMSGLKCSEIISSLCSNRCFTCLNGQTMEVQKVYVCTVLLHNADRYTENTLKSFLQDHNLVPTKDVELPTIQDGAVAPRNLFVVNDIMFLAV